MTTVAIIYAINLFLYKPCHFIWDVTVFTEIYTDVYMVDGVVGTFLICWYRWLLCLCSLCIHSITQPTLSRWLATIYLTQIARYFANLNMIFDTLGFYQSRHQASNGQVSKCEASFHWHNVRLYCFASFAVVASNEEWLAKKHYLACDVHCKFRVNTVSRYYSYRSQKLEYFCCKI